MSLKFKRTENKTASLWPVFSGKPKRFTVRTDFEACRASFVSPGGVRMRRSNRPKRTCSYYQQWRCPSPSTSSPLSNFSAGFRNVSPSPLWVSIATAGGEASRGRPRPWTPPSSTGGCRWSRWCRRGRRTRTPPSSGRTCIRRMCLKSLHSSSQDAGMKNIFTGFKQIFPIFSRSDREPE